MMIIAITNTITQTIAITAQSDNEFESELELPKVDTKHFIRHMYHCTMTPQQLATYCTCIARKFQGLQLIFKDFCLALKFYPQFLYCV